MERKNKKKQRKKRKKLKNLDYEREGLSKRWWKKQKVMIEKVI